MDSDDTLFVVREEPGGSSAILKSETYFNEQLSMQALITGVEEFHLIDKYMFAVRAQVCRCSNSELLAWVLLKFFFHPLEIAWI